MNNRIISYEFLKDKQKLSKSLEKTKACRNVLRIPNEDGSLGPYGTCKRDKCSFAHSLKELRLPICVFGTNCNKLSVSTYTCQFFHPEIETREMYYNRTCIHLPDLPKE